MNKELMNNLGFNKEIKLIESKKCPFCKVDVDENSFRDKLSKKEYLISGLCQNCQDKTFGVEE